MLAMPSAAPVAAAAPSQAAPAAGATAAPAAAAPAAEKAIVNIKLDKVPYNTMSSTSPSSIFTIPINH
jgi:hypothetical protein